jgi:hypothetical protein
VSSTCIFFSMLFRTFLSGTQLYCLVQNIFVSGHEYTQALASYRDKWCEGSLKQERGAIEARTNQLEQASLQASGIEKRQLLELFGFYQIVLACACGDEQRSAIASAFLSAAIETAKEGRFKALLVYARVVRAERAMGRFEGTRQASLLEEARRDISLAVEEQSGIPALYAGLLHVQKGLLDAYTARDKQAFAVALHEITKGSSHIGSSLDDQRIIGRLDEEHCMLARASAYLYAPMGDVKLGRAQLEELDRASPFPCGKRRLARRDQLLANAYLVTDDYPMAAAHLESAVENASEDWVESLIQIHTRLKNTAYGNDPELGRLAVKIYQMKYPEVFHTL